jgi:hypothetical protein
MPIATDRVRWFPGWATIGHLPPCWRVRSPGAVIWATSSRENVGGASHLSRPPISLPSPAPGPSGRPSPPRRDCRSASERPARALGSSARGARNPLLGLGRQTETPALTTAVGWSCPPAAPGTPPGNTPCIESSGLRPDDATFHAGFRFYVATAPSSRCPCPVGPRHAIVWARCRRRGRRREGRDGARRKGHRNVARTAYVPTLINRELNAVETA